MEPSEMIDSIRSKLANNQKLTDEEVENISLLEPQDLVAFRQYVLRRLYNLPQVVDLSTPQTQPPVANP